VVVIAGVGLLFAPLNLAAFLYIPPQLRAAAVGLLALLRNEGGSVGTSVAKTIQDRREQFHVLRLNERLDALYPAVQRWFEQGREFFTHSTGDPVRA
jgi:DHA2 family multidrug resistance protein